LEEEREVMLMMVMMDGETVTTESSFVDDRLPSKDYVKKLTDQ